MRDKVFISYSHRDSEYHSRLKTHLAPISRSAGIKAWSDTQIKVGDVWKNEIDQAISETAVAILLISPDFLASAFIANEELPPLLDAWQKNDVKILPVVLKPCVFHLDKTLSKIQCINDPSEPLAELSETQQDKIWVRLVESAFEEIERRETAIVSDAESIDNSDIFDDLLVDDNAFDISFFFDVDTPDTEAAASADDDYTQAADDSSDAAEYRDAYYLARYLLDNPIAVHSFKVYTYCHIDIHDFIPTAKDVLGNQDGYDELMHEVRTVFKKRGWEGDGVIRLMWFPPFLKIGMEDTWGTLAWYVKQSNNGMSFIASSEAIPNLENFFDEFIAPDEDGYYHTRVLQVRNVPEKYCCYLIDGLIQTHELPLSDETHWIIYFSNQFQPLNEGDRIKFKVTTVKELKNFPDKKNTRNIYISDLQVL